MIQFDAFQAYRKEIELIGCNSAIKSSEQAAEELRFLCELFDSGKLKVVDDSEIQRVSLDEAIEKGYHGGRGSRKAVVIDME